MGYLEKARHFTLLFCACDVIFVALREARTYGENTRIRPLQILAFLSHKC